VSKFRVRIAKEAEEDLAELVDYIAQYDSVERANYVLERLLTVCERLEQHPERGLAAPTETRRGLTP